MPDAGWVHDHLLWTSPPAWHPFRFSGGSGPRGGGRPARGSLTRPRRQAVFLSTTTETERGSGRPPTSASGPSTGRAPRSIGRCPWRPSTAFRCRRRHGSDFRQSALSGPSCPFRDCRRSGRWRRESTSNRPAHSCSVLAIDVFDITQRNRSFNSTAMRDEIKNALDRGCHSAYAGSSRVQHSSHPRP